MVEYPDRGAVILQSFIDPEEPTGRPGTSSHDSTSTSTRGSGNKPDGEEDEDKPPRLVSVVVAKSADQTKEARRAAARLEKIGRDFQKEWATEVMREGGNETGQ